MTTEQLDKLIVDELIDQQPFRWINFEQFWRPMSRHANRIDEVLGFKAPRWVDEIVQRRKIDRREGRLEDIEAALRAEVIEHEGRLIAALRASEDLARMLGHAVIAADLRAMHQQLQRTPPNIRAFYQHVHDPRDV